MFTPNYRSNRNTTGGYIALMVILPFLLLGGFSFAQSDASGESVYGKGRIRTTDGLEIAFTNIQIGTSEHLYRADGSPEEITIPNDKTIRIEVQKGSYALEYGLLVGASSALGAWLGVNTNNTSGVEVSSGVKTGITLALTGVGMIIGFAMGAGKKKYKTVYENPDFDFSALLKSMEITALPQNGLMLRMNIPL